MEKREIVDEIYHINKLLQSLSDKYVFLNKKEEEYSFRFYTVNALNKIVSMLRDVVLSKNISVEKHTYFSQETIKDLIKITEYSEKTHDMLIVNKEKCCILKDNKKYRIKLNEIFNKISTVIYEILDCNYSEKTKKRVKILEAKQEERIILADEIKNQEQSLVAYRCCTFNLISMLQLQVDLLIREGQLK